MRVRTAMVLLLSMGFLAGGCEKPRGSSPGASSGRPGASSASLVEARRGFVSKLITRDEDKDPPPTPPSGQLKLVKYDSPVGALPAYLSIIPKDGRKRPAIIWIHGGTCNGLGSFLWESAPRENDQSGSAFREVGVITLYPALRGGSGGPGREEGFLGEVDDVLAAAEHLSKQEGVDPTRIYLGGHSTGGTLALLTACCSDRFRAVFAFGPVDDVSGYSDDLLPFDFRNKEEVRLRSPGYWLENIKTPTFVIEGVQPVSNVSSLQAMERARHSPQVRFLPVRNASHFSVLAPATRLVGQKIMADQGSADGVQLSAEEIKAVVGGL